MNLFTLPIQLKVGHKHKYIQCDIYNSILHRKEFKYILDWSAVSKYYKIQVGIFVQ